MLGDGGVGKSALTLQYVQHNFIGNFLVAKALYEYKCPSICLLIVLGYRDVGKSAFTLQYLQHNFIGNFTIAQAL